MIAKHQFRVVSVVGARPQFVKAATVSSALSAAGLQEILVHTGQHYDWSMSAAFFQGLDLPEPTHNLQVGSATHGAQTGRILEQLEQVLLDEHPDAVLVYGDTNSTLAGALSAAKLHIPVAHVEAGLRSFNRQMPEELNRVLTDHLAEILFAPTPAAVENLAAEGVRDGVVRTGDVMFDLVCRLGQQIEEAATGALQRYGLEHRAFAFTTVHRAENTDVPARWSGIMAGLERVAATGLPVLWPVHPRVSERARALNLPGVHLVDPLPYLETQALLRSARVVLTDSGGLQKEAAFHARPCVTLRDQTEWVELVQAGVNTLVGADPLRIENETTTATWPEPGLPAGLYGDGHTSEAIASALYDALASWRANPR